jgi:hypothetical protein
VSIRTGTRARVLQHRTVIGSVLVVSVVAGLAYWRFVQPREVLLNCSVAAPRVAGLASPGVVTFRPDVRFESGFAISYSEVFSVGPSWAIAWNSSQPGLRALFLYDAGVATNAADPASANEAGRVEFWWNDLITEPNKEPVADSPWSKAVDVARPGRFCVTLLETPGSASNWTVTVTDRP